jgi:elongator complex protein 1
MEEWKVKEMAQEMADSCEEAKDFSSAATIYLEHLDDLESAVRMLCRAYSFASAIRLVALKRRPELLSSLVDTGLVEASASMTEMLAEMKSQLLAQIPRLRGLRVKKAEDPMAFLDGGVDGGGADIPDNISLAPSAMSTSGGTFMTRYTNNSMGTLATNATRKTSKNRRREERKRARGKKGTVYEEEYLVNSVERLVERWNSVVKDGEQLVEGLMRRGMRERAVAVEGAMKEVREACEGCLEEVFGGEVQPPLSEGDAPPQRIVGGEGVMIEAFQASQQKKVKPVVKGFESCGLLA